VHLAREELGRQRVGREVVLHRHTKRDLYVQKRESQSYTSIGECMNRRGISI
jgi:hypothetical protein